MIDKILWGDATFVLRRRTELVRTVAPSVSR
jgi:hypothetical protein